MNIILKLKYPIVKHFKVLLKLFWEIIYVYMWLRRPLSIPWTARRSYQEINPEYSLDGLLLKMKLQYFVHLMWRANSALGTDLEKTLMLGKMEGKRRRVCQRMRWSDSITDLIDMNLSKFWEVVEKRGAWHAAVLGVAKRQIPLSEWTTICNRVSLYSIGTLLMLPLILVSCPKHITELQFSISLQPRWAMWQVLVNRQ